MCIVILVQNPLKVCSARLTGGIAQLVEPWAQIIKNSI
ncbi:protein of unknown function [Candidatus Nitrosotalea okcheonensis]|uniref:Uncharacterized protein n=1 Tax=Candidatus Nitrosotalea okcheonensis TaxID=1903276 RepID=A0A2H1FIC0_9ARCH|nr:protein of unknown function [Candidatus Nitrosotalea okcheonensis]